MRTAPLTTFLLLCSATAVRAQAAAITPPPPDIWNVGIDFGFNFASGNSSISVLNSALRVTRHPNETAEFEWQAGIEYGRNNGIVSEKRLTSGLKFDYLPQRTVSPFTFVNAEQDAARKIDLQAYGGGGLKYTFWHSVAGKASISAAAVYNYETFTTPSLTAIPSQRTTRWSLRFKAARKFGSALQLENTTFYQPVFTRANDYNINATTSITSKATAHLSLFLRHLYRKDSTPQPGVKPVDQRFTGGLRFDF